MTVVRSLVNGIPTCAIASSEDLDAALDALGIARNVPAIILIGGAAGMTDLQSTVADRAIREGIGPVAAEVGAVVVDGGTDAGVMQLAGQARKDLSQFLMRLAEAAAAVESGKITGIDPRFKELLDAYRSARNDRSTFRSSLMRLGAEKAADLLEASDKRTKRDLLESLDELRRIVERHQQADISAILEEI